MITAGLAGMVLAAILFWKWWSAHDGEPAEAVNALAIDIGALPALGPQLPGETLEFYGVPVRLAVLVLAPVGRDTQLPTLTELPAVVEHLLPNLNRVLERDRPIFRAWPPQLSREGFLRSFFYHLALPGDRGKNTPWCSIAGRFTYNGVPLQAGLVCCAAKPNGLGQVIVEHEGRWLDVIRVCPH